MNGPHIIPQTHEERDELSTSIYETERLWRIRLKGWLEVVAALVITDERGIILDVTQRATDILGYEEKELVGKALTTIIPSRLVPIHEASFKRWFETGEKRLNWGGIMLPALHKDGTEIECMVRFREERQNGDRFLIGILEPIGGADGPGG